MNHAQHKQIVSLLWNIADDILRDLYKRGKYGDVILPMTVLRRIDSLLEASKSNVLQMKQTLDKMGVTSQDAALRQAAGHAFYNISPFKLSDLKSRSNQAQLRADFEAYLDGFSPNVREILECFEFRHQIPRLSKADALGGLIEKFLSSDINLSPKPVSNGDTILPPLDNHAMGTVFEHLIRRFNEENNEEAGQHWTPRDAVKLMTGLIFLPIAEQIKSSTYTLYDGACGTGGMLTVAEETLKELAQQSGKQVATHLFGQEINPETYAICKSDLLLKGEGEAADNIVGGAEFSTISNDAFRAREFDFMLSNPPYGKSWKTDLERLGGKDGLKDPRFIIEHAGESDYSLVTRTSDGQMLFLANLLSKMKHDTPLGSRIAEVHNGSSLFTGDAGQGESNIRRWVIESDWLEAIVALPLNLFYNTGIATYIWVLSNRKPAHRKGKVQLIDASKWFKPLRKNQGNKNCELSDEDIKLICDTFLSFKETPQSKVFPNAAFGYWKIRVERPLRLHSQLTRKALETLRFASGDVEVRTALYDQIGEAIFDDFESVQGRLEELVNSWGEDETEENEEETDEARKRATLSEKRKKKLLDPKTWWRDAFLFEFGGILREELGQELFKDHNEFRVAVDGVLTKRKIKIGAADKKMVLRAVSWRVEDAPPVIAKVNKTGKVDDDPLHGRYGGIFNGKWSVVQYESDPELRDSEQVPLLEEGGIEAFFQREVLPYAPDAWIDESATKIGYEVSFTRHFYQPQKLRSLKDIRKDIEALERETGGLLEDVLIETDESEATS